MSKHPRIVAIVSDPEIRSGEPCFSGTRVPVSIILHWLSEGWSIESVLIDYPQLTRDDILAGLKFASEQLHRTAVAAE
jgi:uncharacterized protein (DUF433 family)